MKKKKTEKQKLKDKADKVFSTYIRTKYSDWRGYVSCYTCGVTKPISQMQNGHFISRSSSTLRFDENNCRSQCTGCNVFKSGNYIEYTLRLIKEEGKKFVEKLKERGKETHQFTSEELTEIIKKYEKKLKNLQSR